MQRPLTFRIATILLGSALLASCDRAPPPDAPAPPAQDSAPAPGTVPAPDGAPDGGNPPSTNPADPAQPPAEAPPPTEPAPAPTPTSLDEPGLDGMRRAEPSAKMGVAADLRYQFDGDPLPNQPVTLHLAAVPRVAGQTLHISLKQTPGLRFSAGPAAVQKVNSADVYRQQYSVTRGATTPASLRVLVTMESPAGSAFGFFTIPLENALEDGIR